MKPNDPQLNRIRWQCRRGMLELDLLLSDFLDNRFLLLPQSDQQDFVRLLNFPDQILLQWLFGNEQEVESDMQSIVKIIRQQGMDHAEQD